MKIKMVSKNNMKVKDKVVARIATPVEIEDIRKEVEKGLKERAEQDCKKCYGRGYKGYNLTNHRHIPCECLGVEK